MFSRGDAEARSFLGESGDGYHLGGRFPQLKQRGDAPIVIAIGT